MYSVSEFISEKYETVSTVSIRCFLSDFVVVVFGLFVGFVTQSIFVCFVLKV